MKYALPGFAFLILFCSLSLRAENDANDFIHQSILGAHDFTLQWLDNANVGKRGKIKFTRVGNTLLAHGFQEEQIDEEVNYMQFSGDVVVVNPREIHIAGELVTRVHHINNGNVLRRCGTFIFKAHGKRQYWRLQNMREHEVMDYVDIHF